MGRARNVTGLGGVGKWELGGAARVTVTHVTHAFAGVAVRGAARIKYAVPGIPEFRNSAVPGIRAGIPVMHLVNWHRNPLIQS